MNNQVTSLEQFRAMSMGEIISLSPFVGEEPIQVRVKKPSMMKMMVDGRIPNSLLATAQELFGDGNSKKKSKKKDEDLSEVLETLSDVLEISDIIAKECLLEPTYSELTSFGLELNEQQLMELFTYAQAGVKALNNFRKQQENPASN